MHAFETILIVLLGAVLLSLVAQRLRLPFPPLLAAGGALAAFLPHAPEMRLDPELVLALFVAPILLDASFDSSPRDLKRNVVPIFALTVVAVGLTVVAAAVTARAFEPGMAWPVAIALGAIVAPPDAAAATSVLRSVPAPHRLRTILEGESLFNDASALLIYRFAVAAAVGGLSVGWGLAGMLVWTLLGSVAFGVVTALVTGRLTRHLSDAPSAILIQFITTFGLWIAAERLGLSAIITTVVNGLVVARVVARAPAQTRAPSYAVWETVVFALNAMAFALVGLQIGPIWRGLDDSQRQTYAVTALAVLVVVIVVRLVWVIAYNSAVRLKNRWFGARLHPGEAVPQARGGLILSWAGMRGVVTLATAFALPYGFPHRDLLLLCAFAVTLGTLVIQGLTLGPLIRLTRLEDDGLLPAEIRKAREVVTQAALDHVKAKRGRIARRLTDEYTDRLESIREGDEEDGRVDLEADRLRREVLGVKRDALLELRKTGQIGEPAYYQLEEEMDRGELTLLPVIR